MAYSEAQKRATLKYKKERLKRIEIAYKLDEFEPIAEAAAAVGEQVATYIKNAVRERMERGY